MLGITESLKDYERWNIRKYYRVKVEQKSFHAGIYHVHSFSTFSASIDFYKLSRHVAKILQDFLESVSKSHKVLEHIFQ